MMGTFREFLLTENAKSEAKSAYEHGMRDAEAGRDKKNSSDFYGPYGGDYDSGYSNGKKSQSTTKSKDSA